jgi:hypothetical protein
LLPLLLVVELTGFGFLHRDTLQYHRKVLAFHRSLLPLSGRCLIILFVMGTYIHMWVSPRTTRPAECIHVLPRPAEYNLPHNDIRSLSER